MKLSIVAITLFLTLMFMPALDAQSPSSGQGGGGISGKIQSVTPTNFSMGRSGGHGRFHRRTKVTLVHYNPDSAIVTVDGVQVRFLDVAVTGKYVTVVGTMKNNVLEATNIAVSSTPPAHHKGKSAR